MKYEVGDLLVGKHHGGMFMVKKAIEINRCIDNGVYMEVVQGYRVANLENIELTFVVSQDQMDERYRLATKENR